MNWEITQKEILDALKDRELTQTVIAEHFQISQPTCSRLFKGVGELTISQLFTAARLLNKNVCALFTTGSGAFGALHEQPTPFGSTPLQDPTDKLESELFAWTNAIAHSSDPDTKRTALGRVALITAELLRRLSSTRPETVRAEFEKEAGEIVSAYEAGAVEPPTPQTATPTPGTGAESTVARSSWPEARHKHPGSSREKKH